MGDIRINLSNFITVSLIGFVGVFAINRALTMANLSQYKA